MSISIDTAVCKTVRSLGFSPRKEHQVENHLLVQLRSSGPEYVLGRLKALSEWRKASITEDSYAAPPWFKRTKGERPKPAGWESNLWTSKPETTFALIGAIRKAVVLEDLTPSQVEKFVSGVRSPYRDPTPTFDITRTDKPQVRKVLSNHILRRFNGVRHSFNFSDITGQSVPVGYGVVTVPVDHKTGFPDRTSIASAYGLSLLSADKATWRYLRQMGKHVEGLYRSRDNSRFMGCTMDDWEDWSSQSERSASLNKGSGRKGPLSNGDPPLEDYPVGKIGLIQEPGGKLRSIANPNRFTQFALNPLGEVLSQYVNSFDGVYTTDQEAGMSKIQSWLQEGHKVYSFDLSSATDTLDFEPFLRKKFDLRQSSNLGPLEESLEFFITQSKKPWALPASFRKAVEGTWMEGSESINWTRGQPLGLRPSFAVLSMMNLECGEQAFWSAYHKGNLPRSAEPADYFAMVGDDFVAREEIAQEYYEMVETMGGQINFDKTMVSDKYAEFCSQLITREGIFPMKPRYILDFSEIISNLERFGTSGVDTKAPKWVKDLHSSLASYATNESKMLPRLKPSQLHSYDSRILALETLSSDTRAGYPDPIHLSSQTMWMHMNQGFRDEVKSRSLSSAKTAVKQFIIESETGLTSLSRLPLEADIPVATVYDYKTDTRIRPGADRLRSLRKTLCRLDEMDFIMDDSPALLFTKKETGMSYTMMTYIDADDGYAVKAAFEKDGSPLSEPITLATLSSKYVEKIKASISHRSEKRSQRLSARLDPQVKSSGVSKSEGTEPEL